MPPGPVFVFTDTWALPAGPAAAYDLLADVEGYPRWWPQVRSVVRESPERGQAVVRSALPYALHVTMTRAAQDPSAGVLRVDLSGDLVGWSEFVLSPRGSGCVAAYRQECVLGEPRMARTAAWPPVAAVMRWNHTWMMRAGQRGAARVLAGPVGR